MSNENEEVGGMTGEVVDMVTNDRALASITRAEVDIQISTAQRFPRSLAKSRQKVQDLATANPEIAASCFYSIPREGKIITGKSARFAEIVASSWGNLRVQGRITEIGDTFVVAQAVCHDLEANVAVMGEARVKITKKDGKRYSEDMIGVACASAHSKAIRNSVFKVVPMAYFSDIEAMVRKVAGGDVKGLEQNRKAALDYLKAEYKVDAKRVCAVLGVSGIAEITTEMVSDLRGMVTAIKEGDATVETCFPQEEEPVVADGKKHNFGFNKDKKSEGAKPADEPKQEKGKKADKAPDKKAEPAEEPKAAAENLFPGDGASAVDRFFDLMTVVNEELAGSTMSICRAAVEALLHEGEPVTADSLAKRVNRAIGKE